MRRVVSSSEILGTCEWQGQMVDVSAHSDAFYDEATSTLKVNLTALAEPAYGEFQYPRQKPDWLPGKQTVEEHVPYAEALAAAKAIFNNWALKVRTVIPARKQTNEDRRNV